MEGLGSCDVYKGDSDHPGPSSQMPKEDLSALEIAMVAANLSPWKLRRNLLLLLHKVGAFVVWGRTREAQAGPVT